MKRARNPAALGHAPPSDLADSRMSMCVDLLEDSAPVTLVELGPAAKGRQPVMPELSDPICLLAQKHERQMLDPEPLARPDHG